ncbi:cell division protein FtsZ [Helicobacter sp. MIT 14-3879]|uniref:cell division protein FtsZ n=1 Tax=Helicobacter sp. MIT 14-3879 TaxID=2040649 RepID=UPI000E1F87FF|nr:cell division protein FtsZ [Helicobacter sp. MIT 14-3879]RDU65193.1 cell division protein FtsZ [Helicobacter sp. MIT 14-3879]
MEINIEELQPINEIKISVVGVGGGGSNTINHLITHGVHDSIKLIALNTDAQHLKTVLAHNKIQVGEKTTRGLGAGMKPDLGKKSAEESYDKIKDELIDSKIVFIATGLGGGTGTGASPIVAKAAKEIGALVIAVVTKPFAYEGSNREKLAEEGLKELKKEVDTIIVIPNEKLLSIIDKSLGMKDSLKIVDNVLAQAVIGISSFILSDSNGGMNIDYADLNAVMAFKGLGLIGIGDKEGEDSAIEAVKEAIESPLFDNVSIKGAKGALVHFEINENYPMFRIADAADMVSQHLDKGSNLKQGWSFNNNLNPTQIRVTLVITGFEKEVLQNDFTPEIEENITQNTDIKSLEQKIKLKKVVGGNRDYSNIDLDYPSFLRQQQD